MQKIILLLILTKKDREFTFSGPIDFKVHFAIPSFLRDDQLARSKIEKLIEGAKYFILHEQRQSGKTSYMKELRDYLNSKKEYACLYINVEEARICHSDVRASMDVIVNVIAMNAKDIFGTDFNVQDEVSSTPPAPQLEAALQHISSILYKKGKKFILLIDEIDSLEEILFSQY